MSTSTTCANDVTPDTTDRRTQLQQLQGLVANASFDLKWADNVISVGEQMLALTPWNAPGSAVFWTAFDEHRSKRHLAGCATRRHALARQRVCYCCSLELSNWTALESHLNQCHLKLQRRVDCITPYAKALHITDIRRGPNDDRSQPIRIGRSIFMHRANKMIECRSTWPMTAKDIVSRVKYFDIMSALPPGRDICAFCGFEAPPGRTSIYQVQYVAVTDRLYSLQQTICFTA